MSRKAESFGAYLRSLRLKAGYGLRKFAARVGYQPSNLSNLERGKLRPPRDPERLEELADALGLAEGSAERDKFFDLAREARDAPLPADLEGYARKRKAVAVLLRAARDKQLTDQDLEAVVEHINKHL